MSIVYLTLFLGIGLLLSIVFPEPSTSLLGAMVVWLASTFLISSLAYTISSIIYPPTFGRGSVGVSGFGGGGVPTIVRGGGQSQLLTRLIAAISPSESFQTAANAILTTSQLQFTPGQSGQGPGQGSVTTIAVNLQQAMMTALPNIVYLVALLLVVFVVSYMRFTRDEIR
jgi:ABC-type transport system involved in multi-copper enzyme maturation permease subunit